MCVTEISNNFGLVLTLNLLIYLLYIVVFIQFKFYHIFQQIFKICYVKYVNFNLNMRSLPFPTQCLLKN